MKKYPKYKDSGIEWIGEIPEHWELKKIKHVSKKIGDGLHGTPEYVDHSDYYFINGNNIKDNNIEISEQTKCVSQKEYLKNLKPLTLNTILLSINGTIGNLALYQNEQIMLGKSVGYIDIIDIFNRSYIYHYLSSDVSRNLFEIELSGSTIKNLSLNSINNHSIPIPSSKEQAYIAEFLNTKTGEIEKSIDIKLRLIELLKEERTAIINHAVTKGINPKVKLKPSGVEWIGEIPEHWEVKRLKHISKKIGDGLHGTPEYVEKSDYYFINGNNIKNNSIEISEQTKCVSQGDYDNNFKALSLKTILLSINGTIGNLALYRNEKIMLGKSVGYIDIIENYNESYIFNYLSSNISKNLFEIDLSGSTIKNLSLNSINNHLIPIPPFNEQHLINNFLDSKTSEIDTIISKTEKEIELLNEYKTALISEVVTGKVDVREEVIV